MDNLIHWAFEKIDKLDREYVQVRKLLGQFENEYHNRGVPGMAITYDEQTYLQLIDDLNQQLADINRQSYMIKRLLMDCK